MLRSLVSEKDNSLPFVYLKRSATRCSITGTSGSRERAFNANAFTIYAPFDRGTREKNMASLPRCVISQSNRKSSDGHVIRGVEPTDVGHFLSITGCDYAGKRPMIGVGAHVFEETFAEAWRTFLLLRIH